MFDLGLDRGRKLHPTTLSLDLSDIHDLTLEFGLSDLFSWDTLILVILTYTLLPLTLTSELDI